MNNKNILSFLLLFVIIISCEKAPTQAQLQGTWTEVSDNPTKTKLIFVADSVLYYFHPPQIDTLVYKLDQKHRSIELTFFHNPNNIGVTSYEIDYHKNKKVLTIVGLLPTMQGGPPSVTDYKQ